MFRTTRPQRLRTSALAVLALVTGLALVGTPTVAGADTVKGSLVVLSVNDAGTGLLGAVAGRPFTVVVQALDPLGAPLAVTPDTVVRLTLQSGTGTLGGTTTGTIPKKRSQGTIAGATYAPFANNVVLGVSVVSGTALSPTTVTVNIASTAVKATASPGRSLNVTDPACASPTPALPVCGYLQLPNGGNGSVLLSVGSCDTILSCRVDGGTSAQLVTADVSLKGANGQPLYTLTSPAVFILGCDKVLCGNGGVATFPVTIDVTNTGAFQVLEDCPAKGVVGQNQTACLDAVQSKRDNAGDLYNVILFVHDIRGSYP